MLWLPPGWGHRVQTGCGEVKRGTTSSSRQDAPSSTSSEEGWVGHAVFWCYPPRYRGTQLGQDSLFPLALGLVTEEQSHAQFKEKSVVAWRRVWAAMQPDH